MRPFRGRRRYSHEWRMVQKRIKGIWKLPFWWSLLVYLSVQQIAFNARASHPKSAPLCPYVCIYMQGLCAQKRQLGLVILERGHFHVIRIRDDANVLSRRLEKQLSPESIAVWWVQQLSYPINGLPSSVTAIYVSLWLRRWSYPIFTVIICRP